MRSAGVSTMHRSDGSRLPERQNEQSDVFGERIAPLAIAHGRGGVLQRVREPHRAVAIVLEEVQRHPLRGLGSDSRQAAQRPGQRVHAGQRLHRGS